MPAVKGAITEVKGARELGMSTEILWVPFINAIQAVAPQGWRLSSVSTAAPTPTEVPAGTTDPLVTAGMGTMTFTGRATTVPDVGAWLDALSAVPGFADATFSTAEISDDEGVVYYETTGTVQLTEAVLAKRFAAEEAQP